MNTTTLHQSFEVAVTAVLLLASPALSESWHVSVGPVYRDGMDLQISGSSYVQTLGLRTERARNATPNVGASANADIVTAMANRTFDDGYVRMDAATPTDGLTWNWGYDNPMQYTMREDTLTFRRRQNIEGSAAGERVRVNVLRSDRINLSDTLRGLGAEVVASRLIHNASPLQIRLNVGAAGFFGLDHHSQAAPYKEQVTKTRVEEIQSYQIDSTYVYDVTGIVPPTAPYAGTYDGPGPIMPNVPMAVIQNGAQPGTTEQKASSRTWTASNQVEFDLHADLLQVWVGPSFGWTAGRRATLFLMPLLSINLLDVETTRQEYWTMEDRRGVVTPLQSWRDRQTDTQWLFGTGIRGGVEIQLNELWFFAMSGGYEWVPEEYDTTIGPNRVKLDISAYEGKVEAGRRF